MRCPRCGNTHVEREVSQVVFIREFWDDTELCDYEDEEYGDVEAIFGYKCLECGFAESTGETDNATEAEIQAVIKKWEG